MKKNRINKDKFSERIMALMDPRDDRVIFVNIERYKEIIEKGDCMIRVRGHNNDLYMWSKKWSCQIIAIIKIDDGLFVKTVI